MRTFTVHLVKRGERDKPWLVDIEAPDKYAAENFARANEALRLEMDVTDVVCTLVVSH